MIRAYFNNIVGWSIGWPIKYFGWSGLPLAKYRLYFQKKKKKITIYHLGARAMYTRVARSTREWIFKRKKKNAKRVAGIAVFYTVLCWWARLAGIHLQVIFVLGFLKISVLFSLANEGLYIIQRRIFHPSLTCTSLSGRSRCGFWDFFPDKTRRQWKGGGREKREKTSRLRGRSL